ncbi:hypothetical protein D3C85_1185010 [compost metagenome]
MTKKSLRFALIIGIGGFLLSLCVSGSLRPLFIDSIEGYLAVTSLYTYMKLLVYRYLGLGFTFILLGILIARYEEKFFRTRVWHFVLLSTIITTFELLYLFYAAKWNSEYKLSVSMVPNTCLLFYGILHIKSQSMKRYHAFISLFSIVTFCGHILFMRANVIIFQWELTDMTTLQNVMYVTMTLIECALSSIIWYNWKAIRRIKPLRFFRHKPKEAQ